MVERADRKKHGEKECGQPWVEWEWMRFPGSTLANDDKGRFEMELKAEFEADGDLKKSIPQLVCDFNFEVEKLGGGAKEERILLTALKCMVAMMAQVAMGNAKVSDRMVELTDRIAYLTRWLLTLTVVIAVLAAATIVLPFLKK